MMPFVESRVAFRSTFVERLNCVTIFSAVGNKSKQLVIQYSKLTDELFIVFPLLTFQKYLPYLQIAQDCFF